MSGAVNIGEFRFGDGRHFQMNRQDGLDAVQVDRQYPDPEKGRNVAGATGLDAEPDFRFPANWSKAERHHARVSIVNTWRRLREREQQAAEAAAAEEARKVEQ